MFLSKSCIYGLRASIHLAQMELRDYTSIRELGNQLDISFYYLTQILQKLTAAGLMESQKGPKGGVRLTKAGAEINLYDIVAEIDGEEIFNSCVLGLPGCGTQKPCPLHEQWGEKRDRIQKVFEETNLEVLVQKDKKIKFEITADGNFQWIS